MLIRPARDEDTAALLGVERTAFDGESEAGLVAALLADPSAIPLINLVAEDGGEIVGHVLLTAAVVGTAAGEVAATILAPLAVAPEAQGRGIGQALCHEGVSAARNMGVGLVFVLGHIDYYPRVGFTPALPHGLEPPYPIDPTVSDAWMVLETLPGMIDSVSGMVRCADALMRPEMWVE